ncbi:class I SAM-dependent methyltransferase [Saccharothrix syringae]|uniref:Class I SAM-dependent methyltransferase n=1 Tax=Saccharothrix syringae TaxID=103733 RepID=A0A5Q0H0H8_SACSY|nr:class I SAM-dependent methyltransferase [Saccharothrix syringae]QFZ19708.1 class I SAM-dependent methyltransferase [Saccharothrix syringae]
MTRFDGLARVYEEMFELPWRRYLESHTVLGLLGDLTGKAVLDLGCGAGDYCRLLKRAGAARVVGHDTSAGMIAHAAAREAREALGVEYAVEPPPANAFDIVLGVYVLPYAEDYRSLVRLCGVACTALRAGGRFVTLPVNPDYDHRPDYYARYGFRLHDAETRGDASKVTLDLEFGAHRETITARCWTRRTLHRALTEAGFTDLAWPGFQVSPDGVRAHGAGFWSAYLRRPHAAIVTCRKGKPSRHDDAIDEDGDRAPDHR